MAESIVKGIEARYHGAPHGLTQRLIFLMATAPALRLEAAEIAVAALAKTLDMDSYASMARHFGDGLSVANRFNPAVAATMRSSLEERMLQIERELETNRSLNAKDGIRSNFIESASLRRQSGNWNEAIKMYMLAIEHSTVPKQTFQLSIAIAECYAYLSKWGSVQSSLQRATSASSEAREPLNEANIAAFYGLIALSERNYHLAARRFLSVNVGAVGSAAAGATLAGGLLHVDDLSTYAALCALASYSRTEVLALDASPASSEARVVLSLRPEWSRVVGDMAQCRFAAVLAAVARGREELTLDALLAPHLQALCGEIRDSAFKQYLLPYSSVDLTKMAESLCVPLAEVESTVASLVVGDKVAARIDGERHILNSHPPDARETAFEETAAAAKSFLSETKLLLLRTSLESHGLLLTAPSGGGGGGGGGGASGGDGGGGSGSAL